MPVCSSRGRHAHVRAVLVPLVAAALSALCPPSATAQLSSAPPRTARAVRTDAAPVIDGRLDEGAWADAPSLTEFVQHEPFDGEPASERTEVRILFDDEALYIGAHLFDSDPSGIVLGESRRDAPLDDTDAIRIVLDTYRDRQNGFVFGTTPAGIEFDGQLAGEGAGGMRGRRRQQSGSGGGFNLNWDASWEVATTIDDRGWHAEFRIPFSTLRYGSAAEQVWGLNIARRIRRFNEEAFWSPVPREFDLYRVSVAGALEGVEPPGERLYTLTPYLLGSARQDYTVPAPALEYPAEFGADAKIGLTPSLTLDLTYNTDFAQVEVDEQQVNLTRFNLFFPEKRPFFLENAGLFSVGVPQEAELFFSRRIGIGPGGRPIPILGGGRVTGRLGGLNVGLLNIQTEAVDGVQPANNYTVARVLRELPNRSRLGATVVNRFAPDSSGDYNRAYALDGRLGIGEAVSVDAWAALTRTPGLDGRDRAFGVRGELASRDWRGALEYREIGEAFNPEVGFLQRSGYRHVQGLALRHVRFRDGHWLRELRPHVSYQGYWDYDGFQQTGRWHVDSHVEFPNGAFFSPAFNFIREGLDAPFEIADGVILAPDTYDYWEGAWRFNTDESAAISLNGGINFGGFLSGRRTGGDVTLTGRRGASLATELRLSHDRVRLPEGEFEVTLAGLRVAYSFTPRIFLQSLVQYNQQAELWSGNVRFGWLSTAGTGLFLVYNERQALGPIAGLSSAGPLDRAFIVKFTRQFDFGR